MSDKKELAVFLFLTIFIIVIAGIGINKLYTEKMNESNRAAELQRQVYALDNTVNNLQERITTITEAVNNKVDSSTIENQEQNIDNDKDNLKVENNMEIKIGTYNADEVKIDEGGVPYDDCGVTFAENNLCSVYAGFGSSHLGTYLIEGNKLICNTLINRGEEGGIAYNECNIIFEFEIINSQKIKLVKIKNNSKNYILNSPGLKEGMTYSFSEDSHIRVLIDEE